MIDILIRAGCFIAIILLGYILKKVGYFKESDFDVLSKITIASPFLPPSFPVWQANRSTLECLLSP